MAFSSLFFVFAFLPITLVLYFTIPVKFKDLLLVLVSILFFAWAEPKYIFLILALIAINYFLGIYLDEYEGKARRNFVIFAVGFNVFILMYFKYYEFFLDSIFGVLQSDIQYNVFKMPLGISFFMFQIIGYLFDIYRKKVYPQYTVMSFALYITFFPKLIMGPITPYKDMRKEIYDHPFSMYLFDKGARRFIVGLAQKVILANTFGMLWAQMQGSDISVASAWLGVVAYTLQIYFDFCGYSHMAIGLGNMFGFTICENFNYPYIAKSVSEFWNRWHISLGRWFKDYIYFPLGGNRVGKVKHIRNLLIIWAITGLWHGANYTFIVWGIYYGVLVILEKYVLYKVREHLPTFVNILFTLFLVMIGWVLFASNTLSDATTYLMSMFGLNGNVVSDQYFVWNLLNYGGYLLIGIVAATPIAPYLRKSLFTDLENVWDALRTMGLVFLLFASISFMVGSTYQSFLYFAF